MPNPVYYKKDTNIASLKTNSDTAVADLATVKADLATTKSSAGTIATNTGSTATNTGTTAGHASTIATNTGTTATKTTALVAAQVKATDTLTDAVIYIDYAHHENHEGDYYRCGGIFATLAAATDYYVSLTIPATHEAHLNFEIEGNTENGYTLYEGTTATPGAGITTPDLICKNRYKKSTSAITVKAGLIGAWNVMTTGTLLTYKRVGSGRTSGGDAGTGEEWILSNGLWIIKFSNYANPGALTGWWKCGWYEVTL